MQLSASVAVAVIDMIDSLLVRSIDYEDSDTDFPCIIVAECRERGITFDVRPGALPTNGVMRDRLLNAKCALVAGLERASG